MWAAFDYAPVCCLLVLGAYHDGLWCFPDPACSRQVRPFPARLERTASSATRVVPQEGSPRLSFGAAQDKLVVATT